MFFFYYEMSHVKCSFTVRLSRHPTLALGPVSSFPSSKCNEMMLKSAKQSLLIVTAEEKLFHSTGLSDHGRESRIYSLRPRTQSLGSVDYFGTLTGTGMRAAVIVLILGGQECREKHAIDGWSFLDWDVQLIRTYASSLRKSLGVERNSLALGTHEANQSLTDPEVQ